MTAMEIRKMNSKLFSGLLVPVWISLVFAVSCVYVSFRFDAISQVKEVSYKSAEKQLAAIDCKDIRNDVLLSIARQTYEAPRDDAKIFQALAGFFFFTSMINLSCVWKYLKRSQVRTIS